MASVGALRALEAEEWLHARNVRRITASGSTSIGTLRALEAEGERHRRVLDEILCL